MRTQIISLLTLLALLAAPASAQKEKRAELGSLSFITGPKGDRPHVPGLNAALLLSADQKEQILAAHSETLRGEKLLETGRKLKNNPQVTEADYVAHRAVQAEAQAEFDRRVAQILTAPQKELIGRFQVIYGHSIAANAGAYRQRLVDSKGDKAGTEQIRQEARETLNAEFARRVSEILTPEQRTAFEQAVAEEKQRSANPKPKK